MDPRNELQGWLLDPPSARYNRLRNAQPPKLAVSNHQIPPERPSLLVVPLLVSLGVLVVAGVLSVAIWLSDSSRDLPGASVPHSTPQTYPAPCR